MSLFKRRIRSVSRDPARAISEILNNMISMQDDVERSYQALEKKIRELEESQKKTNDALEILAQSAPQP